MKPPPITICGVADLVRLDHAKFTHVVSIWASNAPRSVVQRVQTMFLKAKCAFAFFDDVISPSDSASPDANQLKSVLTFTQSLGPTDCLLVHCFAGVSRSAAVAYAIACQHSDVEAEKQALASLLVRHPNIRPNTLIVALADKVLGRSGRLLDALHSTFGDKSPG